MHRYAAAAVFTAVPKAAKAAPKAAEVKAVEPADAGKAAKKARTTLCKWGFQGADVDQALGATDAAPEGVGLALVTLLRATFHVVILQSKHQAMTAGSECT